MIEIEKYSNPDYYHTLHESVLGHLNSFCNPENLAYFNWNENEIGKPYFISYRDMPLSVIGTHVFELEVADTMARICLEFYTKKDLQEILHQISIGNQDYPAEDAPKFKTILETLKNIDFDKKEGITEID